MLACVLTLGACSADLSEKPAEWWHETVGGKIAQQRPPPPGANQPYPNLATVPPKPPPADAAAWNRLTAGLTADRIAARQAAALAPIPSLSARTSSPPVIDASASQPPGASAALQATTTPPATLGQGPPAAKSPVTPLPELQTGPGTTATAAMVAGGPLPPLPTQEPPRPDFAPGPPPPLMPLSAAPPMEVPPTDDGNLVDFSSDSADLTLPTLDLIQTLVADRGKRGISITGYGGAITADPLVQSKALDLAMRRAQALATALVAQGVPYAALRINAEATGRGASLRLLQ